MKYYQSLIYGIVMLSIFFYTSSCKHTNRQNEMLDTMEKNGIEIPAELREKAGFNWADVIFPLSIVLGFSFIGFFIFRKVKDRIVDIGYSVNDVKNKLDATVNDKQLSDKMSKEEKEQFDAINSLFNNKSE